VTHRHIDDAAVDAAVAIFRAVVPRLAGKAAHRAA
jgi:hypothetical protein